MMSKTWSRYLALLVLALVGAVGGIRISSDNPLDVQRYFCDGAAESTAKNIVADIGCKETDTTFIGDEEVDGCKLVAGDSVKLSILLIPSLDATSLTQSAGARVGKTNFPMPGMKRGQCAPGAGASYGGLCARKDTPFAHSVDFNIPPMIPLNLKGELATYTLADQDGKNLICFKFPVFIKAGIAKLLQKKKLYE